MPTSGMVRSASGGWVGANELAIEAAVSASGILPSWQVQAAFTGAPASPTAGISLFQTPNPSVYSLSAGVRVNLRSDPSKRTAIISVQTRDATAIYTVTLGGDDCAYDASGGDGSLAAILAGMAAAIISGAPSVATALVVGNTVVVSGVNEDDYSIGIAASGAGVLACVADPSVVQARLWGADTTNTWSELVDYGYFDRNLRRFENVATCSAVYVEIYGTYGVLEDSAALTYAPTVYIAPAGMGT